MTQQPHDKVVAARLDARPPYTSGAMRLAQNCTFSWATGPLPDSYALTIGRWPGRTPFVIERVTRNGVKLWQGHAQMQTYDATSKADAQQWCEIKARQWLALMLTPVKAGKP